jgi:ATP-dependent exoDNAse (exonuclease V) alpha subunit
MAAYAFTDYRAQGQTIPHVIVDIASPPMGTLSVFNLYVALSRSASRHSICLLQDFDQDFDSKLFKRKHDQQLLDEDARLESLDTETKSWHELRGMCS